MAAWRGALGLGLGLGLLCMLPVPALGEDCQAYLDPHSKVQPAKSCPSFCCGDCMRRYCCSNSLFRFDEEQQLMCNLLDGRTSDLGNLNLLLDSEDLSDYGPSFGTLVAIGITVFAVIVITIILCLTCSCCCLYKACRRPRPVVTTTTATTVVHAAYPQPAVPPSYPVAPYQGYQPVAIQPQPGMPAAPYPTQYPPPYPMQPSGPPAYHETVAAGAGAPYPISQPPYNPAYVDPQKPTY
ncbi:protein shisa-5 isoform X1 [Cygnus atratus]|uniref:protein shisa-5 isoform X1 n=1 Tax=Cygnus atratus TaxID=8868 RepID=UPI0015D5AD20|nr:protein shisa-5 isoform X1 [Cygnus atratus]